MSDPVFLRMEDILPIHQRSIARYGGTLGLRDRAGLEAAVNHPLNVWHYGGGDVFEIGAAYMFHIAQAQAFLDGNKRTAVNAGLTFLALNGVEHTFDPFSIHEAMIQIACREMTKTDLATLLRTQAQQ
jgi:death-on-curing protein